MEFKIDMTKPTLNGHFYPADVLEKAVEQYQSKISQGIAFGTADTPRCGEKGLEEELSNISHKITELSVNEGIIEGDFEFVGNMKTVCEKLYSAKMIELVSNGYGEVDDNGVISNYTIFNFSFTSDSAIQK